MEQITMQALLKDLHGTLVRSTYLVDRVLRDMEQARDDGEEATTRRGPGFEYKGLWYSRANATEVMVDVLSHLAEDEPLFLERYVASLRSIGTKRRYVAQDRNDLYPGRPHLARNSREFAKGWYVGTNENNQTKLRLIKAAARAARLTFGIDLRVQF
jgi:hypothetical protein